MQDGTKQKWINKKIWNWALFDFANSSYAVIIVAFVYAIYFKKVVAGNEPVADFYWSSAVNIAMIVVALIGPVLGAAADYYSNKKTYLIFFTLLSVITTALLYFVGPGMIAAGMILFILSNIGFQAGLGFYDAFLKEISEPENYVKISSFGYAIGYAGSLAGLAAVLILKDEPRNTFPACAVMFLVFSLPFFLFVKENKKEVPSSQVSFVRIGLARISDTINHISQYKTLRNYLISYFLYIDGVNTIIFFSAIYAQTTLGFSISELILFFVIVQVTALAGSFLFGFIADKFGTKRTLSFNILAWAVITASVFFSTDKLSFLIIGGFAGIFLGSTQALSRSLMSSLTPPDKKTEFFGFYSLFEKTSTILGPLTFGLVSWLTGNQRYAIISILIFFVSGFLLFRRLKLD
jgi:UMF1 family MFS transporter